MLIALTFSPGRNPGEIISRLASGKIVLLTRGARIPTGFKAGEEWVCETHEREKVVLARPLKLAAEWPRVKKPGSKEGLRGLFIDSHNQLPPPPVWAAEPAVVGLKDEPDKTAVEIAARIYATKADEKVRLLCGEFGTPVPVFGEWGVVKALEWATPWGAMQAQTCWPYYGLKIPWTWTGDLWEKEGILFGTQVCQEIPGLTRQAACVEGGPTDYPPTAFRAVEGAPPAAQAWVNARLPNPETMELGGLLPYLAKALARAFAEGREPRIEGGGETSDSYDEDRRSGVGEPSFSCSLSIEGVKTLSEKVFRVWTEGGWPEEVALAMAVESVANTLPKGTWEGLTQASRDIVIERCRAELGPVLTVYPPIHTGRSSGNFGPHGVGGTVNYQLEDGRTVARRICPLGKFSRNSFGETKRLIDQSTLDDMEARAAAEVAARKEEIRQRKLAEEEAARPARLAQEAVWAKAAEEVAAAKANIAKAEAEELAELGSVGKIAGNLNSAKFTVEFAQACADIAGQQSALWTLREQRDAGYGYASRQARILEAMSGLENTEAGRRFFALSRARDVISTLAGAVAWLEEQEEPPPAPQTPELPEQSGSSTNTTGAVDLSRLLQKFGKR